MGKTNVRLLSGVLAVSMLISMTGCNAKSEIGKVTSEFCTAMNEANTEVLFEKCYQITDEEKTQYADSFTNSNGKTDDYIAAFTAIRENYTFKVDNDSVGIYSNGEEAMADVTFYNKDYEEVAASQDSWTGADEYIAALEACENNISFTITFEWVKEDDIWKVTNFNKVFEAYLSYQDVRIPFRVDYTNLIAESEWSHANIGNVYYATSYIQLNVYLSDDGINYDWPELTYEVTYNDETLYTGPSPVIDSCIMCDYWEPDIEDYLDEGLYEFTIYDDTGNIVHQDSCCVGVVDYSQFVDYATWCNISSDDAYYNAEAMELDLWFIGDGFLFDWSGFSFDVVYNGNVIDTLHSDCFMSHIACIYQTENEGEFLPEGTYEFIIYDTEGNVVYQEAREVYQTDESYGVTDTDWYMSDVDGGNVYTSPSFIEIDVWKQIYGEDWSDCRFEVINSNGDVVGEGTVTDYDDYATFRFNPDTDEIIPADTYTFQVLDPEGNCIVSEECVVQ